MTEAPDNPFCFGCFVGFQSSMKIYPCIVGCRHVLCHSCYRKRSGYCASCEGTHRTKQYLNPVDALRIRAAMNRTITKK